MLTGIFSSEQQRNESVGFEHIKYQGDKAVFALILFHLLARKPNLEKKLYLFKQILS